MCASWAKALGGRIAPWPFPNAFPAPKPCRLLSGLWAGQSPCGTGYKKRMQEGCDGAAPTCRSKSLLEMQKKEETEPSHFHRKARVRGPLLPLRMCPSNRRLKQRRCSRCILLLSLAEDGLEAMGLQAGEVRSAQLPCALLLLPTAYISFQPMAFTFFQRLGGCTSLTTGWILIFEQFPNIPPAAFPAASCFVVP